MPFTNDIAGGQGSLVRNWLQSANFVTGVSGWQIRKDGNVEFNNGTFRGSITSGDPAGQHIVINNSVTGDAVDVYDASNQLIYSIDNTGAATSFYRGGGISQNTIARISGGSLLFDRIAGAGHQATYQFIPDVGGAGQSNDVHMQVPSSGTGGTLIVDFLSGAFNNTNGPTILSTERGVSGSLVQSDQSRTNNLFHMAYYGGTTDAAGNLALAHGCAFTPSAAVITIDASGTTNPNIVGSMRSAVLGATNFTTSWFIANTGAGYATSIVRFSAIFFG
jgi:hypothetical protein